ncbi:hypothetical protein ACE01N_20270 [Saccharicrinis sp. FJH2]|uniref:hypothetical protein n=1 Tax=Saccharicrinis sp. FJH65 TaxID=3344659 RepID=UPI0035F403EF
MKTLISIILFIFLLNLNKSFSQENVKDIWLGDYQLNLFFDGIENSKFELNELLDLSKANSGIRKYFNSSTYFPGFEKKISWSLNDTILLIDTIKYRVINLSADSLVISPNLAEKSKPTESQ